MARRTKNDMRKIYFILAIAGIMMTTACSKESNEPVITTDEANVTFTVNLDGIDSRVIGDGTTVDQLVFGVFDSDGNEITALRQNNIQIEDKQATVTTKVAMGQKYSFAFWAQKSGNAFYTTTNLKDIVVSYAGEANDENRDAFTASWTIDKVTGPINEPITLTRPFAQLDFVCDMDEWTNMMNANYLLIGSDLVVNAGAYTHYNALTGEASQATTAPFTLARPDIYYYTLPPKSFCGFATTIVNSAYQNLFSTADGDKFWLSMNYILATPAETKLSQVTMNIYSPVVNWEPTANPVQINDVPIKRNHRTVVYVSELTKVVTMVIVIDPSVGGENNY